MLTVGIEAFLPMNLLTKQSTVLIATFSPWSKGKRLSTNGNVEPMLDFFVPKTRKTVLIDQPYPGSDILMPQIEIYQNGTKTKTGSSSRILHVFYPFLKRVNYDATHVSFKIRDFFSVFDYSFQDKTKFDYFIGLEAVNTLAGLFLRKIGKVKNVIYYVSDYSPVRYGKTFFNSLYVYLDRFCVRNADFTWDVSPAMQKARINAGLSPNKRYRVLHVPNALFPSQIGTIPVSKRILDSLVFMGTLDDINGIDLAIECLKDVMKKKPKVKLHIIGGGEHNLARLKKLVKKLGLEDSVIFYGFIPKLEDMAKIIRSCSIGIAPYRAFWRSERWFGDAGKIRNYLAAGLPVVTTHVPPLGKEIVEKGAGIMAKDTTQDFSRAILKLMTDSNFYAKLAKNAKKLSKNNVWENVYANVFKEMYRLTKGG